MAQIDTWEAFLEFFEKLQKSCESRGIKVELSQNMGKILYKDSAGALIGSQRIKQVFPKFKPPTGR